MDATTPQCVGIIMDGNRRWAQERGLPTLEGHRRGAEVLRDVTRAARDRGIKHLVVYAFSTENWKRSEEEVSGMLDLIRSNFKNDLPAEAKREKVRIKIVGQRERFPKDIQDLFSAVEKESASNEGITLWICASYGGRSEIVAAAYAAVAAGEPITEETFSKYLWTDGMPDPDIIIRASGEARLSNFLTWQGVYSELFFVPEYWPAFDAGVLDRVLAEFAARQRRYGK